MGLTLIGYHIWNQLGGIKIGKNVSLTYRIHFGG